MIKRLIVLIFTFLTMCGCADKYADEFASLRHEVDDVNKRLEELCSQVNGDLASLRAIVEALQNYDYITDITPVEENGVKVGYTISFFKREDIYIRHGKNGEDAENGWSPVMGVRQFSDGNWYWTVDGEWLLDTTGTKVQASAYDGKDGEDGEDGKDGINGSDGEWGATGVTPEFKIENGMWYLSVDGGRNWIEYGKAVGDAGAPGVDGLTAETIFDNLTWDASNVYFHLKSGAVIPVPRNVVFKFSVSQISDIVISAGETITLNYTIDGTSSSVVIAGMSDSGWTINVYENDAFGGTVNVTAPSPYVEGKVIIIASDSAGNMLMKPLSFIENKK